MCRCCFNNRALGEYVKRSLSLEHVASSYTTATVDQFIPVASTSLQRYSFESTCVVDRLLRVTRERISVYHTCRRSASRAVWSLLSASKSAAQVACCSCIAPGGNQVIGLYVHPKHSDQTFVSGIAVSTTGPPHSAQRNSLSLETKSTKASERRRVQLHDIVRLGSTNRSPHHSPSRSSSKL